ncbi:hypothetical protein MP228_009004 [Amoeboaphelidium protococcarum]|nr:hypothetical protein MP228_009004 [Amoeboaphelidium protococcarum]
MKTRRQNYKGKLHVQIQTTPTRLKQLRRHVQQATSSSSSQAAAISPATKLNDWYLDKEDAQTLGRLTKARLVTMCETRGLNSGNCKKGDLVEALLNWRKFALPPEALQYIGSIPDLTLISFLSPQASSAQTPHQAASNSTGSQKKSQSSSPGRLVFDADASTSSRFNSPVQLNENGEIPFEAIQMGNHLAKGGYKDVYRGVLNGEDVAVGIINVEVLKNADLEEIEREAQLLQQLRHDNIVRLIGISKIMQTPRSGHKQQSPALPYSKLCVVTEFCEYGDLSDYMRSQKLPHNQGEALQRQLQLMYDIAFGLSYLHGRRPVVIHRDLKSINILIDSNHRAKIADFGLAKILYGNGKNMRGLLMHSVVGTINWQAPEMWQNDPQYDEKVDVYSCGLIFWEIMTWAQDYPFNEMSDFQIYERVGKQNFRPSLPTHRKCPPKLASLIQEMWAADATDRPHINEVVSRLRELMN